VVLKGIELTGGFGRLSFGLAHDPEFKRQIQASLRKHVRALVAITQSAMRPTSPRSGSGRKASVLACFTESRERCCPEQSRTLLIALSHLAPEPVPFGLLRDIAANLGVVDPDLGSAAQGGQLGGDFTKSLRSARGCSLVKQLDDGAIKVHRLVLEFARRRESIDTP